jgi:TetR/AcrR family transcriptional repressor of nem operon
VAPHDAEIGQVIAGCFGELRAFFRRNLKAARTAHQVPRQTDLDELAGHLLGVVLGVRVLARTGANRAQLDAIARPALRLLAMPRRPRRKTSPRILHS